MENNDSVNVCEKLEIPLIVDAFLAGQTNERDGFRVGNVIFSMDDDGKILVSIGNSRVILNRSGMVLNDALNGDIETTQRAISRLEKHIKETRNKTEQTLE